jgi:hypothetical protein
MSLVCTLLLALSTQDQAAQAPPAYAPPVAAASDEGREAMARFRVPTGFVLDLFAAEPHLANPVALAIDPRGRVYVAETFRHHKGVTDIREHMHWLEDDINSLTVEDRVQMFLKHEGADGLREEYSVEHERVRRIVDTDGDGRADSSTVFADGFQDPAAGISPGTHGSPVVEAWQTPFPSQVSGPLQKLPSWQSAALLHCAGATQTPPPSVQRMLVIWKTVPIGRLSACGDCTPDTGSTRTISASVAPPPELLVPTRRVPSEATVTPLARPTRAPALTTLWLPVLTSIRTTAETSSITISEVALSAAIASGAAIRPPELIVVRAPVERSICSTTPWRSAKSSPVGATTRASPAPTESRSGTPMPGRQR